MVIDYARCIGCHACEAACRECGDHGQIGRAYVDLIRPDETLQTVPMICMHCKDPACARSCPTQAITVAPDGTVLSAQKERCIACANCTYACPFGIPMIDVNAKMMVKCDNCYERTTHGLAPMCASVCPSQAIRFVSLERDTPYLAGRRLENRFEFGETVVETNTYIALGANPDYFRGSHGHAYTDLPETGLPGHMSGLGYPGENGALQPAGVSGSLGFSAWPPTAGAGGDAREGKTEG
jgi:Fe-S-cluster-containing dehydrogenase component